MIFTCLNYWTPQAISAKDDAIQSKQKSASVNDEADALLQEVDTKLKVSISGLKKRSADLKGLRNRIQGRIDRINDGFKLFDKEREVGEWNQGRLENQEKIKKWHWKFDQLLIKKWVSA